MQFHLVHHVDQGGSPIVSVDELLKGQFIEEKFPGRQQQFAFSADDILRDVIGSEEELKQRLKPISQKFQRARAAALENTRRYLSMVDGLDVYVATSMRTREHFRKILAASPMEERAPRWEAPARRAGALLADEDVVS